MENNSNIILTDEQIDLVWGNANFGETISRREIVNENLLKIEQGYHIGHTASCILQELGLVQSQGIRKPLKLTQYGNRYLKEVLQ